MSYNKLYEEKFFCKHCPYFHDYFECKRIEGKCDAFYSYFDKLDLIKKLEDKISKLESDAIKPPINLHDEVWFLDTYPYINDNIIRHGKISMLQQLSSGEWKMRITEERVDSNGKLCKNVFDDFCKFIGVKYFKSENDLQQDKK